MPDGDANPGGTPRALTERELLLFVATCFELDDDASSLDRLRTLMRASATVWPQVVDFVNRELLAPTLWSALTARDLTADVPPGSAGRLQRAHALNGIRSERIRDELAAILRCLNDAGIVPVLLKGAVDLHISRYSDPAARVLRDLDLLVPRDEHDHAMTALATLGYRAKEREAAWLTYSRDLIRKGAMMPVDLQWYLSGQRDVLSPEDAFAEAVTHRVGDVEFRTLSPDHQVVHNLLHSELQDHGSGVGFVWLRQLLDFAALCRLHSRTLDWTKIRDRFERRGLGRVPVARLYMAQRLLGLAMPQGIRPTPGARWHYVRCLTLLRWRWSMSAARFTATIRSALDGRLLDVIYGSGGGQFEILRLRLRHGIRLIGHYGLNLPQIIRSRQKKFT